MPVAKSALQNYDLQDGNIYTGNSLKSGGDHYQENFSGGSQS